MEGNCILKYLSQTNKHKNPVFYASFQNLHASKISIYTVYSQCYDHITRSAKPLV